MKLALSILLSTLTFLSTPATAGKMKKVQPKRPVVNRPISAPPVRASEEKPQTPLAPQASNGRVYNVEIRMLVEDQEKAILDAVDLGEKADGYFCKVGLDSLTLKVRSTHLSKTLEQLSKMGEVIEQNVGSFDGRKNKAALTSRVKSNREMMDQYLNIMNRSASFEELDAAERASQQLLLQLEDAMGSLKKLDHELEFATIRLNFGSTKKPTISTSTDSKFAWMNTVGVDNTLRASHLQSLPIDSNINGPEEMLAGDEELRRVMEKEEIEGEEYAH